MLMDREFDLNPVHRYADSLQEVLKQTILNQEVVFRKQVHELHRLYRTQKILMEDLSWKEFDRYNSFKSTTRLTAFANSTEYKLARQRTFYAIPEVGSTQFINQDLLEERQGIYYRPQRRPPDLQQRPLDLQLPADQYISHVGNEFPKKGNIKDSLKESTEVKCSLHGDNVSHPEEVKLFLSIGEDISKKEGGNRTWYNERTYFCSQDVIDLEESIKMLSNEDAKPASSVGFAAPTSYSGDKHELQVAVLSNPVFSESLKKDSVHGITVALSIVENSTSCQEQNSFNRGLEECHGDIPCSNLFTKKQQFTSYKVGHVDLNSVQLDDSSCYLSDTVTVDPSTASSSGVFHGLVGRFHEGTSTATLWRKPNSNYLNEYSDMLQQDDAVNPALMDSNSKGETTEIWARNAKYKGISGSEVGPIDLESVSQ